MVQEALRSANDGKSSRTFMKTWASAPAKITVLTGSIIMGTMNLKIAGGLPKKNKPITDALTAG